MKQPIVSETMTFLLGILTLITLNSFTSAFSLSTSTSSSGTVLKAQNNDNNLSRRSFFQSSSSAFLMSVLSTNPQLSYAAEESKNNNNNNNNESKTDQESLPSVQAPLYYILRVREATEQESRLIKSGKFKDVQRANVKLAVKFMLDNYRLNDNFISASAFLDGERKIKAADIGQSTVQNLITILEYFDSSDVENIKVGSSGLGGKEAIVLNGLSAARKGIDDFVSLFPKDDVNAVIAKIESENELNRQEFDPNLGNILNPKPTASSTIVVMD